MSEPVVFDISRALEAMRDLETIIRRPDFDPQYRDAHIDEVLLRVSKGAKSLSDHFKAEEAKNAQPRGV